jgi:hypothetical protein
MNEEILIGVDQEVQDLLGRDRYDLVALRYLARAHVYAERSPEEAMVYATMANAFATMEIARANWANV